MIDQPQEGAETSPAYQVLARKYRPGHFRDLIGQEAMVQTLTNAFAHDRIAHAFILTGVRGVGKTTTARIIAKGLNCQRDDRPTIDPCGVCEACVSIAEGRNVDVIEMDAASNTGVNDVREIIDSVRYRAAAARYKVYIIDEVHMLSTSAFNALLKTLEEPPPHVKFIFATTEIQKVPVTVLSRCQRFDLRRIEPEVMIEHLSTIARKEGANLSTEALALITRAAEGSVRDALSLLDQAVAHGTGAEIGAAEVRAMLGLADRGRVIDLFEAMMRGDAAAALTELGAQYAEGADPAVVLRDLAELTHWVSVVKITADALEDPTIGADERTRGKDLAARLSMRVLTRSWQMLLKAMEELALAPNAMMAAEMAIIRLTHVADLPTPGDLVRKLTEEGVSAAPQTPPAYRDPRSVAKMESSLDLLALEQVAYVETLARSVSERTAKLASALKAIGQYRGTPPESGIGGPFTPLDAYVDPETFENDAALVTDD
ncbi:MAG: DNA polymerase III subunit gamma/tau, partial [Pseudomonadota bacterium]